MSLLVTIIMCWWVQSQSIILIIHVETPAVDFLGPDRGTLTSEMVLLQDRVKVKTLSLVLLKLCKDSLLACQWRLRLIECVLGCKVLTSFQQDHCCITQHVSSCVLPVFRSLPHLDCDFLGILIGDIRHFRRLNGWVVLTTHERVSSFFLGKWV